MDGTAHHSSLRPRRRRQSPRVRRNRWIVVVVTVTVFATTVTVTALAQISSRSDPTQVAATSTAVAPTPSELPVQPPTPTPTFESGGASIDDPSSSWVIVNKLRPLQPSDYVPADLVELSLIGGGELRAEAATQLEAMAAEYFARTGEELQSISGYRSYDLQVSVYDGWVSDLGQEAADLTSARPGHSEHQTGLAIDLGSVPSECDLDQCFAGTATGVWLAENAYQWGFILRYPDGYTHITGYEYEPWHFRYVGVELAAQIHSSGIATLEEFFGLPAAPSYG